MAARTKTQAIAKLVGNILAESGWTQTDLAERLGVTQGHLSKVINGRVQAGAALRARLQALPPQEKIDLRLEPWLETVREAGLRSRDAKAAIIAIARLVTSSRR